MASHSTTEYVLVALGFLVLLLVLVVIPTLRGRRRDRQARERVVRYARTLPRKKDS